MPIGEGWWIHPDGREVSIFEHIDAVQQDPHRFGLRALPPQARGESTDVWRVRVLTEVMQHGWIRVRHHGAHTVFEFWKMTRETCDAIWTFLGDTLGATTGTILINEVGTGHSFSVGLGQFLASGSCDPPRGPRARFGSPPPARASGESLYRFGFMFGLGR